MYNLLWKYCTVVTFGYANKANLNLNLKGGGYARQRERERARQREIDRERERERKLKKNCFTSTLEVATVTTVEAKKGEREGELCHPVVRAACV